VTLKIIHQRPDKPDSRLSALINRELEDTRVTRARIVVAYVTWNGLSYIADALEAFLQRSNELQVIVGVNNGVTTPDALLYLWSLGQRFGERSSSWIVDWSYRNSVFHPKVFHFNGHQGARLIVGSNNLTPGGLLANHEVFVDVKMTAEGSNAEEATNIWDYCTSLGRPLSLARIKKLAVSAKLSKENSNNRRDLPIFDIPDAPRRKPLFKKILDIPQRGKRNGILKNLDKLSRRPRRLFLQILGQETGGGDQIQLPVAALSTFFGVGSDEERAVHFEFEDWAARDVHLTHFGNNTHRIRLRPVLEVPRPAIIEFNRMSSDSYACRIVREQDYAVTLAAKCDQQTRQGSRRWGLE
jgi:HKD family nuclease